MATEDNNVIYLEVDEDITSAIDKLTKAAGDSLQVVTAKRSTLFQSVINVKLLKKAADDANKKLVLVTSDRVVTNLAGRIGVPVASQVGETPVLPTAAAAAGVAAAAAKIANSDDEIDGGSVAAADAMPIPAKPADDVAPPEAPPLAPEESPSSRAAAPAAASAAAASKAKPAKPAKDKKVPNISKMQKRLLWAAAGIFLLLLVFAGSFYFTSANVTLYAKADQVNATFPFTADPNANSSNIADSTLAAQQLTSTNTVSTSVQGTGTKDKGTKASGNMTVYNAYDSNPHALVAGTRFVSSDGHVFRSTADATVPGGTLSGGKIVPGQTTVGVQADANGDQYNQGPGRYSIPGLAGQSEIYGMGGQMQGGTTKTATVIAQADVDKAQKTALDGDKPKGTKDVTGKANKNQTVIGGSVQQTVTSSDVNPDVGAEAQTATLSLHISYSALAVQKTALSDLTKAQVSKQVGPQSQVYDDGSSSMQITSAGAPQAAGASQKFNAKTTAYAGTKIDTDALAKQIKGKKYGEAVDISSHVPGVDHAEVKLSPGWATSVPRFVKHIHIQIKVADQSGN